MATDARISTSLPSHPKTKKLIRRLGFEGGWHLLRLFLWAAENRSNGDLAGLSDEDIELAIDWTGTPGDFVSALVDLRFVDGEEHARTIHDWEEHNPWAAGSDKRAEKSKWAALCKQYGRAEAAKMMPEYAARLQSAPSADAPSKPAAPAHGATRVPVAVPESASGTPVAETGSAPSPSPSPSPSPLNTPLTPQGGERARKPPRTPEEETADLAMFHHHFWPAYPKKADKQAAYRAWRKLRVTPELLTAILAGLELWKRHHLWTKDGGQFRHNPATWLNGRLWEDEEVCGGASRAASAPPPNWCTRAGFECVAEAHNRMCWEHNAHLFRDGQRIPAEEVTL